MTRVQNYLEADLDKLRAKANKYIDKVEKMEYRIVNISISSSIVGIIRHGNKDCQ